MTVSDNNIQGKVVGDFFKKLGKKEFDVSKKTANNVLKNQGQALDIATNIATAEVSRKTKTVMLSTQSELISFYNTGKGLYLENLV